ncbi:hypothetical protein ABIA14_005020 [Sinorhizobium fredii]
MSFIIFSASMAVYLKGSSEVQPKAWEKDGSIGLGRRSTYGSRRFPVPQVLFIPIWIGNNTRQPENATVVLILLRKDVSPRWSR